ncbi:MAG: FeoA family protein [Acidaminococcaceae bacterium]|nr:FeoA family protein [Acidaminococcaceae bacterium]
MMPLIMAKCGDVGKIAAVRGKPEIKRYLESMGFVEGALITVISEIDGNLIVNVKDARVALSRNMASKIFV